MSPVFGIDSACSGGPRVCWIMAEGDNEGNNRLCGGEEEEMSSRCHGTEKEMRVKKKGEKVFK